MYCDDLRPAASASAKPALPASLRTATSSYGEARKSICALSPASHLSLIRSTIRSAGLGDYVDLSTGGCMRRTKLQIVDDARGLVGLSLLSPPAAVAPEPPPPPLCSLTSPQAGLTGAPSSAGPYQCDDKCGSFWQKLPVSVGGRDTKENAPAAYHFAVHANVLCGASGVNRFTFVPKNIKTGSNFGLSNLLMVLVAARESGGLPSHVRHLYRHTDGGPDNVAWTTHFFHWLLVYLGVFDEITWFRFKAGHSHTEIADRLFSVIKQYFEADNTAARVDPVGSFFELQQILTKAFAKSAEGSLFHWHFCSWDIEQWLKDIGGFSEEYGGYSDDLVFNYKYVPSLYRHGCVKVRHKHAVAWTGSSTDAEWAPVEEKTRSIPSPDGDGLCDQKYNATTPNGLLFVTHPPDLTVECKREAYSEKAEFVPTDSIRKILSKRADDLAPADKAHWQALQQVHEQCAQASTTIPNMPFDVQAGGQTFTFDGLPRPLIPLLKELMIFERPLLGKEPFEHPPPPSWDEMHAQMLSGGCSPRP